MPRTRRRGADVLALRITLEGIEPPIWRYVLLDARTTLHGLHQVIQCLFEWYDYHMYGFSVGGKSYEAPDEEAEGEDSTRTTLRGLGLKRGDEFTYVYDRGDDWMHRIVVEQEVPSVEEEWLPSVSEGARAGPPEDCGGPGGFERLLEALANPADEEHESMLDWVGPEYDPERFDIRATNHALVLAWVWGAIHRKQA
jgi:hypothetical protein